MASGLGRAGTTGVGRRSTMAVGTTSPARVGVGRTSPAGIPRRVAGEVARGTRPVMGPNQLAERGATGRLQAAAGAVLLPMELGEAVARGPAVGAAAARQVAGTECRAAG